MQYRDLRDFIAQLESLGDLKRISKQVSPVLEITEISDRVLRARGPALGTIARKGGETGGLAVEYLCSALASANPKLVECASEELAILRDPEVVDCIVRALGDSKIREPVRKVLKLIDTPEARAALGNDRWIQ